MTDLGERRGLNTTYYEPAEDSYLLATACVERIRPDDTVLDVGTGSGFVAAAIHDETGADVTGIDCNPHACQRTAARDIPVIRGNIVDPCCHDSFDVVVCNPPYLPTAPEEVRDDWLGVALSGGETGRDFVNRLFDDVGRVLRPDGRLLLLVSSLMDVARVRERAKQAGLHGTEIDRDESFPFEVLLVLEFEH